MVVVVVSTAKAAAIGIDLALFSRFVVPVAAVVGVVGVVGVVADVVVPAPVVGVAID